MTDRFNLRRYITREPVMLAVMAIAAILFFIGVTALSRLHRTQQQSLANRWFARGVADLNSSRFDRAVIEFRTALVYSRDDYGYQLKLAESLLGLKRTA